MVETLEVRDMSRVKGLVELGGVVEAGKEVEVDKVFVIQYGVVAERSLKRC
jgi:hypothetical protein